MLKFLAVMLLAAPFLRLPRNQKPPPPPPPTTTSIALTIKTSAGDTRANIAFKGKPPETRATATMKSGEIPEIRWMVRNVDFRKPIKDVVVHFLVTRAQKPNEPIPSGPRKGSAMDQVMGMTLAPKGATTGDYKTALFEPGIYLVEVELLDPSGYRQQYCALDLKVE